MLGGIGILENKKEDNDNKYGTEVVTGRPFTYSVIGSEKFKIYAHEIKEFLNLLTPNTQS